MRRLTVVQLLPALESGGVERSTLEIAEALVRAGHRAIVVSAGGRLVTRLQALGAEHVELDIGRKSLLTLRHVRALRALLARERVDLVHARSRLPAWIGVLALRGLPPAQRPRLVTTVHGLNSPSRYSAVMTRGERVICVSQTVRDYVLQHYPRTDPGKLRVIPRGIDPAAFPRAPSPDRDARTWAAAQHLALAGDGPLLLLPGRGTRLKGHADALALLASLRSDGSDARLWLPGAREAGREAYIAELEALGRGARHRRRARVHRAHRRDRPRLRRQRPGAAAVAQARGVRPYRGRGAVRGSAGAGLGAWRRRRSARRTAADRRRRAVRRRGAARRGASAARASAGASRYDPAHLARDAGGHACRLRPTPR